MNLFTRNIPYFHLLKYLLFLLKHPVYKPYDIRGIHLKQKQLALPPPKIKKQAMRFN